MKNDAILEDAKKWIFNKLLQNKPNTQDSDSRLLTMEEIKNKPGLEATLLHEAIHAALKNKNGTGMLYAFNEEEQDLLRKKHGRCAFLL